MKQINHLLAFLLALLFFSFCGKEANKQKTEIVVKNAEPSKADVNRTNESSSILDIREKYQSIEKANLQEKKVPLQCEMGESKLSLFYQDRMLKKIVYEIGADHGHNSYSLYFHDEKIFFAYIQGSSWHFISENNTIDTLSQERYYFVSDKPIRCLKKEVRGKEDLEKKLAKATNATIKDCSAQNTKVKLVLEIIADVKNAYQKNDFSNLCL